MSSPKADDIETEGSVSGDKIRIKFIFANRDGLNVEIEYPMSDSVGMLKSTLLSMWPKEMGGEPPKPDRLRLICMGKGILGPDNISIEQSELPVFLTHPTPINVSVKPFIVESKDQKKYKATNAQESSASHRNDSGGECCCVIS